MLLIVTVCWLHDAEIKDHIARIDTLPKQKIRLAYVVLSLWSTQNFSIDSGILFSIYHSSIYKQLTDLTLDYCRYIRGKF